MVTGPQRSGTTITGQILAKELNFKYIDEMAIQVDNFDRLFAVYRQKNFVLQAPGLSAYAHMMPGGICFMRRPIEEIIKSEKRINWQEYGELREKQKYFQTTGNIAQIKYDFWDNWQRTYRKNMLEIEYSSIEDHPLYVSPEIREAFAAKQTKVK